MDIAQPSITVDCVVFDKDNRLLLIRRKSQPFFDKFALPGGFVEIGETTEQAAARELKEETDIDTESMHLVGVYSDPDRDPRGHVISIAYLITPRTMNPSAGDDAAAASFVANWRNEQLAFDHSRIIEDSLRVKSAL